jgi:DNA invertase Pin-like site-specific DNA recombinase
MDSGVEFVAVDNPHANKLTVHILAAVAQYEREAIAQRNRDALQAAKAHDLESARQRALEANSEAAERFAPNVLGLRCRMVAASRIADIRARFH